MPTVGQNYAGQQSPDIPDDDLAYVRCNFAQPAPIEGPRGVRLWPDDDTPRTFILCNLTNAEPPPGSTITECNTAMVVTSSIDEEVDDEGLDDGTDEATTESYYGKLNDDGTYRIRPSVRVRVRRREKRTPHGLPRNVRRQIRRERGQ